MPVTCEKVSSLSSHFFDKDRLCSSASEFGTSLVLLIMQVSAVMGPSGCGKSTLLSVLMGNANYGSYQGQIWINGREMKVHRLRRITGYVPQVIALCHVLPRWASKSRKTGI